MRDKLKNLAACLLAIILSFGMCVPVFADGSVKGSEEDGTGVRMCVTKDVAQGVTSPELTVTAKKVHVKVNMKWIGDYHYVFSDYSKAARGGSGTRGWTDAVGAKIGLSMDDRIVSSVYLGPMTSYARSEWGYGVAVGSFEWAESDSFYESSELYGTVTNKAWSIVVDPIPGYDTVVEKTSETVGKKRVDRGRLRYNKYISWQSSQVDRCDRRGRLAGAGWRGHVWGRDDVGSAP